MKLLNDEIRKVYRSVTDAVEEMSHLTNGAHYAEVWDELNKISDLLLEAHGRIAKLMAGRTGREPAK